jgi:hypothetical protein
MHHWKGGGPCNFLGATHPAISVRADSVTIKNFGVTDSPVGIEIMDHGDGSPVKGVSIENVEIKSCYKPITLPHRSVGLLIKESILE